MSFSTFPAFLAVVGGRKNAQVVGPQVCVTPEPVQCAMCDVQRGSHAPGPDATISCVEELGRGAATSCTDPP